MITRDGEQAVAALTDAQRRGEPVLLTRDGDAYTVAPLPRMIDARDRAYYAATYRVILPSIAAAVRLLPTRTVRALANRADRREAEAHYAPPSCSRADYLAAEARRVGILRRIAVDRFDARASATVVYYTELRRRSEGS